MRVATVVGACIIAILSLVSAMTSMVDAESPQSARFVEVIPDPGAVFIYIEHLRAAEDQACSIATSVDDQALLHIVISNLPEGFHSAKVPNDGLRAATGPDYVGQAANQLLAIGRRTNLVARTNLVVARLCKNGSVDQATLIGYALTYIPSPSAGGSVDIEAGTPLRGGFDELQSADWDKLFTYAKYDFVGFLPIFGDNSDIINARLERDLGLSEIKEVRPLRKLCENSVSSLLVVGQGSIGMQPIDPLRLAIGAGAFQFNEPSPWGGIYTAGTILSSLAVVPSSQDIAVDIYDCRVPNTFLQIGGLYHHFAGHKTRNGFGSNAKVQRVVLDDSIADLQNQIECIIKRRLDPDAAPRLNRGKLPTYTFDKSSDFGKWCLNYYASLKPDAPLPDLPPPPQNLEAKPSSEYTHRAFAF